MSDRLGKHLLIAFALTLTAYAGFYQLDNWLRTRHGPWRAEFAVTEGAPVLRVRQPALGLTAELRFEGETHAMPETLSVVFDDVLRTNVPFGAVVFQDLTYLPGTVTLNCFGHEIELLPRTVVINRRQVDWSAAGSVALKADDKLPPDKLKPVAR